MSEVVTINKAAIALGKSPSTVRRWIQKGAPTVRPGEVGRGRGSIVRVKDLLQWRGAVQVPCKERLDFIASALMDCLRRDEIHERIGITSRQTAGVLALVYERYHKNLLYEPLDRDKLPEQITQLLAIWVECP